MNVTLVLLLLAASVAPADARARVLIVFDEDKDFPGLAIVNRSLRETFRSDLKGEVEFYSDSLNLSQFGVPIVFCGAERHNQPLAAILTNAAATRRL